MIDYIMKIPLTLYFQKNLKLKYLILLAMIIVCVLCLNGLWHAKNELPQGKDTFSHLNKLNIAWKILRADKHPYYYKDNKSYIHNLIFIVYDYPFFYYYASLFFYLIAFPWFGFKAVYISSAFFSCLLIIFTYKNARILIGRDAGILAAYLCAVAPFNITNSRNFNLETTLIATISMTIYLFLRSHFFTNRKFSLLCALAASVSMLTRATAAIPLSGIIIWFFAKTYSDRSKDNLKLKIRLKNFLLFLLAFLSITLIYYGNYDVLHNHLTRSFAADIGSTGLLNKIQFYGKGIFAQALGGNYIFAALFTLILIRSAKLLQKTAFFTILIPLGIIILLPKSNLSEELEWILPVLPLVVIVLSSCLRLKNKALRNSIVSFMLLFLTLQCTTLSFQERNSLNPWLKQIFTGKILAPQKCPAYNELFADLSSDQKSGGLKLGIIAKDKALHFIPIFSAAADLYRKDWKIIELTDTMSDQENITFFDYIMVVSGEKVPPFPDNSAFSHSIKQLSLEKEYDFPSNYFEISEFVFLFKPKQK